MKKITFIFIVFNIVFLHVTLAIAQNKALRIMPLGDSITEGFTGTSTANYEVGYRQKLYLDLVKAGYNINFVGSLNAGNLALPGFDYNHEGHGGWLDSEVAGQVYSWLVANPADVVLLHIGTNGPDPSPDDVELILDEIDRYSKDIIVVLALIINNKIYNPVISAFNNNMLAMAHRTGLRIVIKSS